MNILILAAGYATRLYPLTLHKAKPLLPIAGRPMIEWLIDNLTSTLDSEIVSASDIDPQKVCIEKIYIVTNHKFANDFQIWADNYVQQKPDLHFRIINDGSFSEEDKRGAIGDIYYVLHTENIKTSDLLVVAGDNLFSDPIGGFAQFAKNHPATLALYDVKDLEAIKKYNNITTDANGRITHFEEKPQHPTGTLTGIALYYYRQDILPLIEDYILQGNNPDQPGLLIQWLYTRLEVHTWKVPGTWYDIGSKETLKEADVIFSEFAKI